MAGGASHLTAVKPSTPTGDRGRMHLVADAAIKRPPRSFLARGLRIVFFAMIALPIATFVLWPYLSPRADRVSVSASLPVEDLGDDVNAVFGATFSGVDEHARAYVIDAEPEEEDSAELAIPLPNVEPATYLIRLQIDGAESALDVDEDEASERFGRYIGPTVVVT